MGFLKRQMNICTRLTARHKGVSFKILEKLLQLAPPPSSFLDFTDKWLSYAPYFVAKTHVWVAGLIFFFVLFSTLSWVWPGREEPAGLTSLS